MKKTGLILLVLLSLPSYLSAQNSYFHELRGMEDSAGTTHLFYRLLERIQSTCNENGNTYIIQSISHDVHHFNTVTEHDSVLFNDYYQPWCLSGMSNEEFIIDYDFYNSTPEQWLTHKASEGAFWMEDFEGNLFDFPIAVVIKATNYTEEEIGYPGKFQILPEKKEVYVTMGDYILPFDYKLSDWPIFEGLEDFSVYNNSGKIPFRYFFRYPFDDSQNFAINSSGHLYSNTGDTSAFKLADSSVWFNRIIFDADSSFLYADVVKDPNVSYSQTLYRSSDFGKSGSWVELGLPRGARLIGRFISDPEHLGTLFISETYNLFRSMDYGETFSIIFESDYSIEGIYRKPDSDIIYILTAGELLEMNILTLETTVLRELIVANEPEPTDLPNQVVLYQNYPNPFNPSTNISYALPSDTYVELKVYDRLGREIQFLVNEYQTKGVYSVRFRTYDLSSGVYYYQLIARDLGEKHSKKMFFIK